MMGLGPGSRKQASEGASASEAEARQSVAMSEIGNEKTSSEVVVCSAERQNEETETCQ